jgi:hypothetical protein
MFANGAGSFPRRFDLSAGMIPQSRSPDLIRDGSSVFGQDRADRSAATTIG